jgi:hypothetical protein
LHSVNMIWPFSTAFVCYVPTYMFSYYHTP